MYELVPIAMGLMLGAIFSTRLKLVRPVWVKAIAVALAGISVTVVSGEYQDTEAFAIVDIGEVALAAWIASFLVQRLVARRVPSRISPKSGAARETRKANKRSANAALGVAAGTRSE
jgi:hypothetical protein